MIPKTLVRLADTPGLAESTQHPKKPEGPVIDQIQKGADVWPTRK